VVNQKVALSGNSMKGPIGAGFRVSPFRLRSAQSGGCGPVSGGCLTCRRDWNLPSECGMSAVQKRSAPPSELVHSMKVERLFCHVGRTCGGAEPDAPRSIAQLRGGYVRTFILEAWPE
jgi:hypothetical protein